MEVCDVCGIGEPIDCTDCEMVMCMDCIVDEYEISKDHVWDEEQMKWKN